MIPEWRDDGHLSLTQYLPTTGIEADFSITREADKVNSLGRAESHLSLLIFPKELPPREVATPENAAVVCQPDTTSTQSSMDGIVITNDGDIHPSSKEWNWFNARRGHSNDEIAHESTRELPHEEPSLTLLAKIPEKCNLFCELIKGGHVFIDKKLEGDVHITTSEGDVRVSKLRGHDIFISAQGTILASDLLEAQRLEIDTRGRLRAKRIHGKHIQIKVESEAKDASLEDVDDEGSLVDVSSMYVSRNGNADVFVTSTLPPDKRAVRVKCHHGHVTVQTNVLPSSSNEYPCVELGGVNGSFDVEIQKQDAKPSLAGRVHVDSLSADSVSIFNTNAGHVSITLDRKVEADLRMVSSCEIDSFDARTSLLEDDHPHHLTSALKDLDAKSVRSDESRVHIATNALTVRKSNNEYRNIAYVDGWIENQSNEPDSRFDMKSGKIRLESAAEQSLQGFCSEGVVRPLVAIATNGTISLESLSWLGALARRYGFDEPRNDLGRTASRSGRRLVPRE